MSRPRYTTMLSPNADGSWSSTRLSDSEIADYLARKPANEIHFADEYGEKRTDTMTVDKAISRTLEILPELFRQWVLLRSIMSQYELILNKRWLKKTVAQRRAMLLEISPHLPQTHRPEFAIFRNQSSPETPKLDRKGDTAMRYPQFNVEDLVRPKSLLLMLDSRSRNYPSLFATTDFKTLRMAIKTGHLFPFYLRGYTMYFNSGWDYGRICSWEDDPDAITKYHQGLAPDPGLGIMILQYQEYVVAFLVRCCRIVLHDIVLDDLCIASWRWKDTNANSVPAALPRLNDKICSDLMRTKERTLTEYILEAPYRVPDTSQFTRLKSLMEAKHHQVRDQLMLLREDPGYFAEFLQEACNHTFKSLDSRDYPMRFSSFSEDVRNESVGYLVYYSFYEPLFWKQISDFLDDLVDSYTAVRSQWKPGDVLPEQWTKAVFRLETILIRTIGIELALLPRYLAAVPSFRPHIRTSGGRTVISSFKDDDLLWLLVELLNRISVHGWRCELHILFQEIELLVANNRKQRERLTPSLLGMISSLSLATEVLRQLGLSTFRDCNFFNCSETSEEERKVWVESKPGQLKTFYENFIKPANLAPLIPDLRVFDYPSEKPRTATSAAQMRNAEQALDKFWQMVDELCVSHTGTSNQAIVGDWIIPQDIQRTPSWIPILQSEVAPEVAPESYDVQHALATLVERTERTVEAPQPCTPREKPKTRGQPANDSPYQPITSSNIDITNVGTTTEENTTLADPRIKIKKKAFSTFAALFGKPVADTLPGEIPWSDFKRAMVNVGFGAEKLQGSAWLFSSASGNIIFHEPHPESKMPMQWARRIARRLNRNFGWTMDTFVLQGVEADGTAL
ncbi:MAG: hypothetical protein Q9168_006626 [Polycauliona sp. 1 TL-2023]